jgi:flagellar biosynthesis component FlhA
VRAELIKDLPREQGDLVKDIVPAQITVSGIQRVLQLLLNERVSIRDLATILEGIADALSFTRNSIGIAEHVRTRLARQMCAQHTTPAGYLPLIALSAKWEQNFAESIVGTGDDRTLAMKPSRPSEFITSVRERFEDAARKGEAPAPGAAEKGRQHLTSRRRLNQRNVNRSWNLEAPSYVGKRSRIGKGSGKGALGNRGMCCVS